MHPLLANSRTPRVVGEKGAGAAEPATIIFRAGRLTLLSLNPLEILIVHSPACGSVNEVVYSPRFAVGLTPAFAISPLVVVAWTFGCRPASRVTPCWRTENVRAIGLPA